MLTRDEERRLGRLERRALREGLSIAFREMRKRGLRREEAREAINRDEVRRAVEAATLDYCRNSAEWPSRQGILSDALLAVARFLWKHREELTRVIIQVLIAVVFLDDGPTAAAGDCAP